MPARFPRRQWEKAPWRPLVPQVTWAPRASAGGSGPTGNTWAKVRSQNYWSHSLQTEQVQKRRAGLKGTRTQDWLEQVQFMDSGQHSRSWQQVLTKQKHQTVLNAINNRGRERIKHRKCLTSLGVCLMGLPPGLSVFEGILTWKIKTQVTSRNQVSGPRRRLQKWSGVSTLVYSLLWSLTQFCRLTCSTAPMSGKFRVRPGTGEAHWSISLQTVRMTKRNQSENVSSDWSMVMMQA